MEETKTELAACPYCGEKDYVSMAWDSRRTSSLQHYGECHACKTQGPAAKNRAEAIAAWNKHFVCPDKRGDSVYAGDEVKFRVWDAAPTKHFRKCQVVAHRAEHGRHGYGLVGQNGFWTDVFRSDQIELIKEGEGVE